jgi:hypothetical protein
MLTPISTRIVEFLGADLPPADEPKRYLEALRFAQMAWNYAIFPPNSCESNTLDSELLKLPARARSVLSVRIGELVERKKRMYPDDYRIIVSIDIEDRMKEVVVKAAHYDYQKRAD